jgi:hypothetical protein
MPPGPTGLCTPAPAAIPIAPLHLPSLPRARRQPAQLIEEARHEDDLVLSCDVVRNSFRSDTYPDSLKRAFDGLDSDEGDTRLYDESP